MDSILQTIKQMLGLSEDYTAFDKELPLYINSAIMAAHQLGVGQKDFAITGPDETWSDWLGETASSLSAIQSYIYMKVRLAFDPPANSFVVNSFEKQLDELTWRLNVQAENGDIL